MLSLSSEAAKLLSDGILGSETLPSLEDAVGDVKPPCECGRILLASSMSGLPYGSRVEAAAAAALILDSDMLCTRSRRVLRMSSSREWVASFRLRRSVALSLLRRLSWDISFCSEVAMLVRLRIWDESALSDSGARTMAVDDAVFVMLASADDSSIGSLLGSR